MWAEYFPYLVIKLTLVKIMAHDNLLRKNTPDPPQRPDTLLLV